MVGIRNQEPQVQIGDVYGAKLPDGRYGAVRVLDIIDKSYLLAVTQYIGETVPDADDALIWKVLLLNRFRYENEPAISWYDGRLPKGMSKISSRPVSEEEKNIKKERLWRQVGRRML